MKISKGRIPSIFVSSTCYDLSQIRMDLKIFIEQMGFEPILSEFNSFPLDPNLGTVENCLRVVQERTDLLVLIIGGRYGYQTDNGKSITNLEYLHARARGLPVYVFVAKSILSMIPLWKDNLDGNFSSVVDSPKLFEFVETLRSKDNVWIHGFEYAQDIIDTFRKQLAYLLYDSLTFRKQIVNSKLSQKLLSLKGESFRIVIEKPIAWEYRLFGQVFEDGVKEAADTRRDLRYGILFGKGINFYNVHDLLDWISNKINELTRISTGLDSLINDALVEAIGVPGQPGDADHIVYVAEKVVEAYKYAIRWETDFKSVEAEEEYQVLLSKASKFSETLILDLENYCERYNSEIAKGLLLLAEKGGPIELDLTITLQEPRIEGYMEELKRLKLVYGVMD